MHVNYNHKRDDNDTRSSTVVMDLILTFRGALPEQLPVNIAITQIVTI